jgi:hypothetical protein
MDEGDADADPEERVRRAAERRRQRKIAELRERQQKVGGRRGCPGGLLRS